MKLSSAARNRRVNDKASSYQLCIGLVATDKKDSDPSFKPISFECSRKPGEANAATYTVKQYPFCDGDSCEYYINVMQSMDIVVAGQSLDTNEEKKHLVHQLFEGATRTAFDNEMPDNW